MSFYDEYIKEPIKKTTKSIKNTTVGAWALNPITAAKRTGESINSNDGEETGEELAERIRAAGEPLKSELSEYARNLLANPQQFNPSTPQFDVTDNIRSLLAGNDLKSNFSPTMFTPGAGVGPTISGGDKKFNFVSGESPKFDFVSGESPKFDFATKGVGNITSGMSAFDERIRKKLEQGVRDSLAARGINTSGVGAKREGSIMGEFYDRLSAREFEREMAKEKLRFGQEESIFGQQATVERLGLARGSERFREELAGKQFGLAKGSERFREELAGKRFNFDREMASFDQAIRSERLRGDQAQMLFSQEAKTDAQQFGQEESLKNRQESAVELAMRQNGIQYNRDLIEFQTNLIAAGIPFQQGMQITALIQNGEIGAATVIMQGIGMDQAAQSAWYGLVGDLGEAAGEAYAGGAGG